MNPQTKKQLVLGALLAAAAVFVVRAIFFSGPPPPPPSSGTAKPGDAGAAQASAPAAVAGAAQPAKTDTASGPVNLAELTKNVQVVEFQYDPTTIARNPMSPLVGPQAIIAAAGGTGEGEAKPVDTDLLTQQMAVTGIIWDKKFPVAVINNDVVAPGDQLANGIVVKTIEPNKVILSVRDHEITLPLKQLEEQ